MDRIGADLFRRDRLTWIAYLLLGWYAYLQAAPGLVVAHLRDELGLELLDGRAARRRVRGGQSTATASSIDWSRASEPERTCEYLPGTSHLCFMEKPALVNRLILDFLAEDLPPQTMLPVRRRKAASNVRAED